MPPPATQGLRARDVQLSPDRLAVDLADGRTIIVPLAWFPPLRRASPQERANWHLQRGATRIAWPDVGLEVDIERLLRGRAATGRADLALRAGGEAPRPPSELRA